MKKMLTKLAKSSIISSICLAILGILLIIESEATIISISYVIGGILIALGIIAIIRYIKNYGSLTKNEIDIIYGIVCAVLGILIITNPFAIASVIPFIIGIIIIINSAIKLNYSIELKKNEDSLWKSTMIISLITIIFGLVLIFNPFKGAVILTQIVGIFIIMYSILDIISTFRIRKTILNIHKELEEKIIEADIVEEEKNKDEEDKKDE